MNLLSFGPMIDNDLCAQFRYVGAQHLLKHIVCLGENFLIEYNQVRPSALLAIAEIIKSQRLPVLNLSVNPMVAKEYLPLLIKHFDADKFFVLNSDCRPQYSSESNIAPWPAALLLQQCANRDYTVNFDKIYRISALMRQTRLHRLALMEEIQYLTTEHDVVVANKPVENNIPISLQGAQYTPWIKNLPWANKNEFLDLECTNNVFNYTEINHPAYRAMINITNESWCGNNTLFISEKTWKAYASACMVVNYGSTDMPDQLEKFGFEIWKEYDVTCDYQLKIKIIAELFQRPDIEYLYKKNIEMIRHNQQLSVSIDLARRLTALAIEKITNLL